MTVKTPTWTNAPTADLNADLSTVKFIWRLLRYRPWLYLFIIIVRVAVIAGAFQATGLIIRGFFDALTGERSVILLGTELGPMGLSLLLVAVALLQAGVAFADITADVYYRFTIGTLMRKNLFTRILNRTGAKTLPGSTGDALSRIGTDVEGVVNFIMRFPHLIGMAVLAISAVIVMLTINARITILAFIPLVIIVTTANIAMRRVQLYHDALREASGDVSSYIGELFGAVQAVKVASAENRMMAQFRKRSELRQNAALKDNLFGAILNSVFENIVSVSTGLILILAGLSIRSSAGDINALTVGDLALFIFYLSIVTGFISQMGELSAEYKRAEINKKRVQQLLQGDSPAHIVAHTPVYLRGELPPLTYKKKTDQDKLETLEIRGLSYRHPQTKQGVENISFTLARGTLTVITGRVGSGKTTLVRTLLGLLPKDSGTILWNGEPVSDPGSFFVVPYCAYTPQVPVLFSESVRDNILMGLPEAEVDLPASLRSAVMEPDIAALQDGLDTVIGVRGVRLSGGQAQRTAAARMFVRSPELLLFDDLSSALDVETERQLWDRLLERKEATCLAVSHRRSVLRLADNIILLKDGKVKAIGDLNTLLESCEEMQYLWESEMLVME